MILREHERRLMALYEAGKHFDINDPDEERHAVVNRELAEVADAVPALLEEVSRLRAALGDAAREINCAGPVASRIRVLKTDHGARVGRMEARLNRVLGVDPLPHMNRVMTHGPGGFFETFEQMKAAERAVASALGGYAAEVRRAASEGLPAPAAATEPPAPPARH